ncbi:MAG: hypothetical protein ACYDBW_03750 [Sulfuricaulis sp.]
MSESGHGTKMNAAKAVNGEAGKEAIEVTEAIKALQMQLADLRKIVQAAKPLVDPSVTGPGRRQ